MPVYEYKCKDCEHTFETIQKITDEPLDICESCGSPNVARIPSCAAVHFKCRGFYCTDNPK
jgi:putative FmdB family regulatory protein